MEKYPRFTAENNVDIESGCLYRFVYGANDIFNPHCHDYYELFMTVSGTVTHWINGVTSELPKGSLVFIRPDDIHGYIYETPKSVQTSYINFTFTKETAGELFSYLTESFPSEYLLEVPMPPTVLVGSTERKQLVALFEELNTVNWQDKNTLKIRTRVILADIFTRFFYDIKSREKETMPPWLINLNSAMQKPENFIAGISRLSEISKKSDKHISRNLKKHFDMTPSEYINSLRINYASNLLINTNTPVIDVCYMCGFQNLSYFYRVFKRTFDLSPKDFRSKYTIM